MIDKLVSFPTAKLAYDKEFKEDTLKRYTIEENGFPPGILNHSNVGIPAPTQSLLQKWLREVHGILCFVTSREYGVESCNGYYYHIGKSIHSSIEDGQSKTYEEALEIGLHEALKLIK